MIELNVWKYSEETQHVIKELKKEVEKTKSEILDFGGLMTSPVLEREYCRALGYLDGLQYVITLIEENIDESKST